MDYTITKVSEKPPRVYEGSYGKVYYTKVMLQGHERPVEIGKKQPNTLKAGDVVTGEIKPTQYEADGFKAIKKDFNGSKYQPKDEAGIKAMWAVGQAVILYNAFNDDQLGPHMNRIEATAKELFAMVDRVKTGVTDTPKTIEKQVEEVKGEFDYDDADAPVSLSDIPF